MKIYSMKQMEDLEGGSGGCAVAIGLSAAVGGLFGGIGALVGAVVAATGPSCAGLWNS